MDAEKVMIAEVAMGHIDCWYRSSVVMEPHIIKGWMLKLGVNKAGRFTYALFVTYIACSLN